MTDANTQAIIPVSSLPTSGQAFVYESVDFNTLPNAPEINTDNVYKEKTLSVAFETGTDVTSRQVIYEQGGVTRGLSLYIEDGELHYSVWNNGNATAQGEFVWAFITAKAPVSPDEHYTADLVYKSLNGVMKGYLNGELAGERSIMSGLEYNIFKHTGRIGVGQMNDGANFGGSGVYGNGFAFTGAIEKIASYNRALDGEELDILQSFMAQNHLPPPPNQPPVANDDTVFLYGTRRYINVLENDLFADDDDITIVQVTQPDDPLISARISGDRIQLWGAEFAGDVSFTYTISDSEGRLSTATVTATVDKPPRVKSDYVVYHRENERFVIDVNAEDVEDSEGNGLTYSLSKYNQSNLFQIDAVTGELSFIKAPDFENPHDPYPTDNTYGVTVYVTDSAGGNHGQGITIRVQDVNEFSQAPQFDQEIFFYEQINFDTIANAPDINSQGPYALKTISVAFETGADINSRQVIYEQGGATRGLNIYIEDGELHYSAWNRAEANWGVKTISTAISASTFYTSDLIFDAFNVLEGHLNGVLIGSETDVGLIHRHTDGIGVGKMNGGSYFNGEAAFGGGLEFQGEIKKLASYNARLRDDQLRQLQEFMASTPPLPSGSAPIAVDDDITIRTYTELVLIDVLTNDTDPDGDELTITTVSNPREFGTSITVDNKILLDPDYSNYSETTFTYEITDGAGNTDSATVTATLDTMPTITSDIVYVYENELDVGVIDADDDYDSFDGALSVRMESNGDSAFFDFDPITRNLTFKTAPDYENPADANNDNQYEVMFTATDSLGDGKVHTVYVTVEDIANEQGEPNLLPPAGAVFNYDYIGFSRIADDVDINTSNMYTEKTVSVAFETADDVTSRQVVYEQGGVTRGLSIYIENGELYYSVWNFAESKWGYKSVSTPINANQRLTADLVFIGEGAEDFSATGTLEGFLNGESIGTVNRVGILYRHAADIGVGQMTQDSSFGGAGEFGNGYAFDGSINKLTSYNSALAGDDLDQLQTYMANGFLDG